MDLTSKTYLTMRRSEMYHE